MDELVMTGAIIRPLARRQSNDQAVLFRPIPGLPGGGPDYHGIIPGTPTP
jgi:hypothetical protein